MNKSESNSKKDELEELLIDQSNEGLKKLILKGKKKASIRSECEKLCRMKNLRIKMSSTLKLKILISKFMMKNQRKFI